MVKVAKASVLLILLAVLAITFGPSGFNPFGGISKTANRKPLDAFTLAAVNGPQWGFEDHRGEVILLNFWATWCPPCRAETPALVKVHNDLARRGFSVVAVSMDDDPASVVPAFVQEHRVSYPVFKSAGFSLADRIETLPTSLLIDKHGRIARTYTGMIPETILRRDIEALLSES